MNGIGVDKIGITWASLQPDQYFSKLSKIRGILDLIRLKVEGGKKIWNIIENISVYLNETGYNEFISEFVSLELDKFRHKLYKMKETIQRDFDELCGYDIKKASLTPAQEQVLALCRNYFSLEDNWAEMLRQEFYLQWIDHIKRDNPQLKGQPFEIYLENCERLKQLIIEHRKLAVDFIARKIENAIVRPELKPRRTRRTSKNNSDQRRLTEDLKWNKLMHELSKKRRILSVRKLIEAYGSIIFNIIPCWLVSPEAVSAVFPLKRNQFDLIIFDEASQMSVEKALTALYRGDHIVITGDEKQLRPFDLFKMKGDEDEEYEEDNVDDTLLSESLLILAKRIYNRSNLRWHYRSIYQELIDYSNHAFYDGDLQVAPSVWRESPIAPIRWINCKDGLWIDRRNLPEAELVVDELKNILLQQLSFYKK